MAIQTLTIDLDTENFTSISFHSFQHATILGETVVHQLARAGDTLAIERLMEKTAAWGLVDAQDDFGNRPLHEAVRYGKTEALSFLLACGATPDSPLDPLGASPLMLACEHAHSGAIRLLLRAHANVNARHALSHQTPLHFAAAAGCLESIGLLISHHADIFAEDRHGQTPRDLACAHGHTEAAAALLKAMQHQYRHRM